MTDVFVHSRALVESDQIGSGTRIWAFAHVMPGSRIGRDCNVCDHVFVESEAVVGNNVTLKNNVCVWAGVTLGDDVFVGPNVSFTNDRFPRSPRMAEVGRRYASTDGWLQATIVERGATIGANATILPGIRLGRYSMVAAGAVVSGDVLPFALMMGTPARRVGDVCRCGQRLDGPYETSTCTHCGETPKIRCQTLETEVNLI